MVGKMVGAISREKVASRIHAVKYGGATDIASKIDQLRRLQEELLRADSALLVEVLSPIIDLLSDRGLMEVCNSLQWVCDSVNFNISWSSNSSGHYRPISQFVNPAGKHVYLVYTLIAAVKSLEGEGMPSKHAEAIVKVLSESSENMSQNFVSKVDMQERDIAQEAYLSKLKFEMLNSQEHQFTLLQREIEKLRNNIENTHVELRYEINKAFASLRLDSKQEFYKLGAHLEAAKNNAIKCLISTLVSLSAVGIGMIHIFAVK